ncbi:GDSL-type esterase/lipase family protein [Paenibacillus sp. MY03]|uniref:SGNH/GDSL hydrolase family protein n=1 Tax=Paenibacillus sp. MY03 TaxID=302980 RepID=UPI0015C5EFF8|nr:GDSL-type esterase/lipase family protein [Paenibacillus sp. MY03]
MSLPNLNDDLNIIQGLGDRPNALDGLSAAELKQKFDQSGNTIKTFINDVLLPALALTADDNSGADNIGATAITDLDGTTVQALIESIRNKLRGTTTSSSGADFVGATTIGGLAGNTVQALLESLKTYVDNLDVEIGEGFVSKTELTDTRKLDPSANFTGSWFGISNPAYADPGIAGVVADHTAQLAETEQQIQITNGNIDFYNLSQQKSSRMIPLTFNSDTNHFNTYEGSKACNGIPTANSSGTSGWVMTLANIISNRIIFNMPIGVIIGDSISEGHPALHGRLDAPGYDPNLPNSPGQISYHIEQHTKLKIYNHGIGGQRFDQVRTRWGRDVLAETVGSLSPTNTLPKRPHFVILVCGINDVFAGRTPSAIIADADYLINNALENNIYPIVFTIGPHSSMDAPKLAVVKQYNAWLLDKASKTPNMAVFDFYAYANDPANDGKPRSGIFADAVHPNKRTYEDLARKIIQEAFTQNKPPVVPKYINISTAMDFTLPIVGGNRPTAVLLYINGKPSKYVELLNDPNQVIVIPPVKEFIETIAIEPQIIETPYELPANTMTYSYISEVYLSDTNLYPGNEIDKESVIRELPSANAISRFYPARPDGTTAGLMTFVSTADAVNCSGIFCLATADDKGYIVTKGLAIARTSAATYAADLLVTSTGGRLARNVSPTAGTVVAKVIKPAAEYCLVDVR